MLSLFSYFSTNKQLLMCDIQGKKYRFTDPQVPTVCDVNARRCVCTCVHTLKVCACTYIERVCTHHMFVHILNVCSYTRSFTRRRRSRLMTTIMTVMTRQGVTGSILMAARK